MVVLRHRGGEREREEKEKRLRKEREKNAARFSLF